MLFYFFDSWLYLLNGFDDGVIRKDFEVGLISWLGACFAGMPGRVDLCVID